MKFDNTPVKTAGDRSAEIANTIGANRSFADSVIQGMNAHQK